MSAGTAEPGVERVLENRDRLGETPLWCDETDRLWWIDIEEPRLQSFDPETGAHRAYPYDCASLGSLALTRSGRLLVAEDLALTLFDPTSGTTTPFAELEHDIDNRLNDGRVDPQGRFWVGSMDNALHRPQGSLYRVDPDGSVTAHLDGIVV